MVLLQIATITFSFLSLLFLYLHVSLLATLFHFRRQSITGPLPLPFLGNTLTMRTYFSKAQSQPLPLPNSNTETPNNSLCARVMPYLHVWSLTHGRTFLFWFGRTPRLVVGDPQLVRQVVLDQPSSQITKVSFNPLSKQLFGEGLAGLRGDVWALHRRIVAPGFAPERVKGWVPEIGIALKEMLGRWEIEAKGRSEFELEVGKQFHEFSADVISRVAFGSSYKEGRRIFDLQEEQMELVSIALRTIYIPGFRFIPTKTNRRRTKVNNEIRGSIRRLIEKTDIGDNPKNLIELMLLSNKGQEKGLGIEEIIDECKTFYFAGKETTAHLLTWAVLLLALNKDWQGRCREEILSILGDSESPTAEDVGSLKLVGMVLNETLRLYPPAVFIRRIAIKSTKLKSLDIPAGTEIFLPLISINYDAEVWGDDAAQFNPMRFAEGKKPVGLFFPFGYGPSICVGQMLALVEAKVALAMILKKYMFSVSPVYVHAPTVRITLQPQYGVQVVLQRL